MIYNVFDFGDSLAKDIMIPRVDMIFAHIDATRDELIDIFKKEKFTRLPVYEESTDDVIGILNMKDMIKKSKSILRQTKRFMFPKPARNLLQWDLLIISFI